MIRPLSKDVTDKLFCLSLLTAGMCFVAIFPMPYGYYTFLRWVVSIMGVALALSLPRSGYWGVAVLAAAVAILFNPIVSIPFGRDVWKWLDAGAGLLFLFFCFVLCADRIRSSTSKHPEGSFMDKLDQVIEDAEERIRSDGKPDEVIEANVVIEDFGKDFDPAAFGLVAERVRASFKSKSDAAAFCGLIRESQGKYSLRVWVLKAISDTAGALVESGEYHFYRGSLHPSGPGEALIQIFDATMDELCSLGAIDPDCVLSQKADLRKNIATVG